jgi:hypothetical protein
MRADPDFDDVFRNKEPKLIQHHKKYKNNKQKSKYLKRIRVLRQSMRAIDHKHKQHWSLMKKEHPWRRDRRSCCFRKTSRVRIRMYRYGVYKRQYRYHIGTNTPKVFTDQSTGERVPVPVQSCADRGVGCIFFSSKNKTTTDTGTVKSKLRTMSLHTWIKNNEN